MANMIRCDTAMSFQAAKYHVDDAYRKAFCDCVFTDASIAAQFYSRFVSGKLLIAFRRSFKQCWISRIRSSRLFCCWTWNVEWDVWAAYVLCICNGGILRTAPNKDFLWLYCDQ